MWNILVFNWTSLEEVTHTKRFIQPMKKNCWSRYFWSKGIWVLIFFCKWAMSPRNKSLPLLPWVCCLQTVSSARLLPFDTVPSLITTKLVQKWLGNFSMSASTESYWTCTFTSLAEFRESLPGDSQFTSYFLSAQSEVLATKHPQRWQVMRAWWAKPSPAAFKVRQHRVKASGHHPAKGIFLAKS